jgi:hypothetical protein
MAPSSIENVISQKQLGVIDYSSKDESFSAVGTAAFNCRDRIQRW